LVLLSTGLAGFRIRWHRTFGPYFMVAGVPGHEVGVAGEHNQKAALNGSQFLNFRALPENTDSMPHT
jgi:hypothetical protein